MSGEEWEDLYKYRMSPVAFECCKISNGERDCFQQRCCQFLKKLRLGLSMTLKDN